MADEYPKQCLEVAERGETGEEAGPRRSLGLGLSGAGGRRWAVAREEEFQAQAQLVAQHLRLLALIHLPARGPEMRIFLN